MNRVIEYGHIYINDMKDFNLSEHTINNIKKSVCIAKSIGNRKDHFTVLVDDKDYDLSLKDKDEVCLFINDLYSSMGLKPNSIEFEKSFSVVKKNYGVDFGIPNLPALISDMIRTESFRSDNKKVDFFISKGGIDLKSMRNEFGGVFDKDTINKKLSEPEIKIAVEEHFDFGSRYTCSFLATLWTLHKQKIAKNNEVITILDRKYAMVETNIDLILKSTNLDGFLNTRYFY